MANIAQALRLSPLPILESRMLMQRVTGFSRVQLLTRDTELLNPEQLIEWNGLLQRRIQGEPMAYILGEREFYGRVFQINEHVLIPRPDTEILIDTVLQQYQKQQSQTINVLDLGTGSGAIAVTLAAESPNWQVTAVDISTQALAVAQKNAKKHAPNNTQLVQSDWFAALDANRDRFDLIVSNPPYIPVDDHHLQQGDLRFEPRGALSDEADGLQHYRTIIAQVPQFLRVGGRIYLEHGFDQGAAIRELLHQSHFTDIQTVRDLAGHERVSSGQIHLEV